MTIATETPERRAGGAQPMAPHLEEPAQREVTVAAGADAAFSAQLSPAGGQPTSLTWSRGEQELGPSERVRFSENNNTVVLSLQRVTRDDVGTYSLVAKNAAGESRATFDLRLLEEGAGPAPAPGAGDGEAPAFLRRLSDLAVKVGTRTRFLVEIRSSSDVQVAWHRNDERVLEGERFAFLHEGNFFCVDVGPVMVEDGGRWTCMAENTAGRSSCSSYLNVLVPKAYKAPEFVEELRALLTEQGTVSLECKVVGVPTPALRWYKDGREIRAGDVFALSADPADPTALGTYTCEASNCMGRTYSSSRVHVVGKGSREGSVQPAESLVPSGPAPAFVKDLLPIKCKIGEPVTLTCQVRVPPWPKSISWYNREGRVEASEKYHVMEDGLGGYMVEISPMEAVDEGEWKCVATSSEGAVGISTTHVAVSYPKSFRKPRFLESLKAILTEEGLVSFECKVVGSPTPQLRWFKDGQELRPGDVYQLTGTNTLGSYSCIARNCMGEATSSAELTVEDIQSQLNEEERLQLFTENQPPKFVQGLKSCEGRIGEDFRLTVQVSISPEPTVAWYRDDENVVDSDRYHLSREHLGTCHLDIRPLEIMDQAEWKCVATNEFGHSVTSCFLKLHIPKHFKKPRFLECLRAILSEEGAVNLECKVIGVPQPVLRWYKDGEELKPGDIHRIISGQDGTCCLGTYTCEARNCMGTVASSASLLGFEDRIVGKGGTSGRGGEQGGAPPPTPPGAGHPIARNPSLSTIHEERTSQMYESPATERSITAEERPEISFSFDGREVSVSLYETPDLTEEEALQVVEMYADQLSEHVSEHNVVDLPPMRFVKESSHSGKLVMEAVVIDVTGDYFSAAEDDLRTERDVDELSISDDSPHTAALLPADEEDGVPFDKINAEFLERALAPLPGPEEAAAGAAVAAAGATGSTGMAAGAPAPRRPPRRRGEASPKQQSSETYHSVSPPSKGAGVAAVGGSGSPDSEEDMSFSDAHASIYDTPSQGATYASARGSLTKGKEEPAYQVAAIEERLGPVDQSTKSSPAELVRHAQMEGDGAAGAAGAAGAKRRGDASELPRPKEPKVDSSVQAGTVKPRKQDAESGQGDSFENLAAGAGIASDTALAPAAQEATQQAMPAETPPTKPPKGVKRRGSRRTPSVEAAVGTDEGPGPVATSASTPATTPATTPALTAPTTSVAAAAPASPEVAGKRKKRLSAADIDLPTLSSPTPEDAARAEAADASALTRSLQDIQRGLALPETPPPLTQAYLAQVEEEEFREVRERVASPADQLLQGLQQLQEQQVQQQQQILQQQQLAVASEMASFPEFKVLEAISQPAEDLREGLWRLQQEEAAAPAPRPALRALAVVEAPLAALRRGVALVEQAAAADTADALNVDANARAGDFGLAILEAVVQPLQDLQCVVAQVEQQAALESDDAADWETQSAGAWKGLAQPVQELQRGLAEVTRRACAEAPAPPVPPVTTTSPELRDLDHNIQHLTREIVSIAKLSVLRSASGAGRGAGGGEGESEALASLSNLAPPLIKLQKQLVSVERSLEQPLEQPPAAQRAVVKLAPAIVAFREGLSAVEHHLEGDAAGEDALPQQVAALEQVAVAVERLQAGVAELQGGCPDPAAARPLQELQRGLAHTQQAVLEAAPELLVAPGHLHALKELAQAAHELEWRVIVADNASKSAVATPIRGWAAVRDGRGNLAEGVGGLAAASARHLVAQWPPRALRWKI